MVIIPWKSHVVAAPAYSYVVPMFPCMTWQSMRCHCVTLKRTPCLLALLPYPWICKTLHSWSLLCSCLCSFVYGLLVFFCCCCCCKPLHNSLSRTTTRGLLLSQWYSLLMCETAQAQHRTGFFLLPTTNSATSSVGVERKCVRLMP